MWLQQLRVKHVRNLQAQAQEFSLGSHLLLGANGSGKTSYLEAIHVLLTGHSFRTHHLKELIAHQSTHAEIEAQIICRGVHYLLQMQIFPTGKKQWMNRRPCRDWLGLFPCSCWVPEDLQLVRGSPSHRRRFLDAHLIQVDPLYAHHLMRYQKALEQRTTWLRLKKLIGIEAFEAQMALSAAYLVQARESAIEGFQSTFQTKVHELGFIGEHHLSYEASFASTSPEAYQQLWASLREQEIRVGQTLKGPHVDDMKLIFQGQDARRYASEGQARGCVAALKMAEANRLAWREGQALILVDEIGMGLDAKRSESMAQWIKNWPMSLVSTPVELSSAQTYGQVWQMQQGELTSLRPIHPISPKEASK